MALAISREGLNANNCATHASDAMHFFVHAAVGHFDKRVAALANRVTILVGGVVLAQPLNFIEKNAIARGGSGLTAKGILREHRKLSWSLRIEYGV
jgi:hypothetical protein